MARLTPSKSLVRTPHGELYVSRTGPVMVFQEPDIGDGPAVPHDERTSRVRRAAVAWIAANPARVAGVTCFRLYLSDLTEL